MELSGKVALITGGSSGIGLALAQELLAEDIKGVVLVDINPPKEELNEDKVVFFKADVSDIRELEEAFKKTIETFKNLDIVFNNAGILDDCNWKKLYTVNLIGATNCMVLAIESYLSKYKTGSEGIIVNTSSIAGLDAFYCYPHYSASKFAVTGLTRAYGSEFYFNKTGVKVMAICPGVTDSRLYDDLEKNVAIMNDKDGLFEAYPPQTTTDVAKLTLEILKNGFTNGSLWMIIDAKKKEVNYPEFLPMLTQEV